MPLAFRMGSILIRNRIDINARKEVVEALASTVAASLHDPDSLPDEAVPFSRR